SISTRPRRDPCPRGGTAVAKSPDRRRRGWRHRRRLAAKTPIPHTTEYAVFPVRLVIARLWADPPIASEGVIRTGARSKRGTSSGPWPRGFLSIAPSNRDRGP